MLFSFYDCNLSVVYWCEVICCFVFKIYIGLLIIYWFINYIVFYYNIICNLVLILFFFGIFIYKFIVYFVFIIGRKM